MIAIKKSNFLNVIFNDQCEHGDLDDLNGFSCSYFVLIENAKNIYNKFIAKT